MALPLAGVAGARTLGREGDRFHVFSHDFILGTSLDFAVRGASAEEAERLEEMVLDEVERLRRVLSTYDAASELSQRERAGTLDQAGGALREVVAQYAQWETVSEGVLRLRASGRVNVDALGKAYILEAALTKAAASTKAEGLLLNLGGDLAVRGQWEIGIEDPRRGYDNVAPARVETIRDCAVAASGVSERGAHLIDGRTGLRVVRPEGACVCARSAVTANALSTWMAITGEAPLARYGARNFAARSLRPVAFAGWAKDHEVTIQLKLKAIEGYRVRRPYVAVWAEDEAGKLVRNISLWAERPRWIPDLYAWSKANGGSREVYSLAKATRGPGSYKLLWDGMDEQGKPVPAGNYRIWIESNREHGTYAKESAVIACGAKASVVTTKENSEFEAVEIKYGPRGEMA